MTAQVLGRPRFLAYNCCTGRLVTVGMDARQILNHIRDHLWPAVDANSVEIFDCGPNGVDAEAAALPIGEARARFPTVYRGAGVHGLEPVALQGITP